MELRDIILQPIHNKILYHREIRPRKPGIDHITSITLTITFHELGEVSWHQHQPLFIWIREVVIEYKNGLCGSEPKRRHSRDKRHEMRRIQLMQPRRKLIHAVTSLLRAIPNDFHGQHPIHIPLPDQIIGVSHELDQHPQPRDHLLICLGILLELVHQFYEVDIEAPAHQTLNERLIDHKDIQLFVCVALQDPLELQEVS